MAYDSGGIMPREYLIRLQIVANTGLRLTTGINLLYSRGKNWPVVAFIIAFSTGLHQC